MPLQLLKSAKFPFFGNWIILPCVQSSGSSYHISAKIGYKISAAVDGLVKKRSAHNSYVPGVELFPRLAIAALISAFFVGIFLYPGMFLQGRCLLGVVDPVCLPLH